MPFLIQKWLGFERPIFLELYDQGLLHRVSEKIG